MKKLFWGLFFIYLNFNLEINQHSLNVLPDFVGYILLIQGVDLLKEESPFFEKARPYAVAMAIFTAVLWIGAVLGVASEDDVITVVLTLIAAAVKLYISWILIQGVAEIEKDRSVDLNCERLLTLWKALVAIEVIMNVLRVMMNLANVIVMAVFSVLLLVAGLIVVILYLLAWKKTTEMWDTRPIQTVELEEE